MTKQEALIVIGLIRSQLEEQISKLDIVSKSDFDEYLSNIEIKENTITKIVNQIFSKLEELENRKIEIPSYENIKNDIMQFVEANMPKDGINGLNGEDGRDGKDGVNGLDGKDGLNGKDGKDGKNGKDGLNGKDGKDGRDGVDGKDGKNGLDGKDGTVPDHEITGRMIRFKKPNGEWGEYIKLISRGGGVASSSNGGVDYSKLTELFEINDTDFIVLLRENIPYKVSISTLKGVFGGETVDNTITTETGVYLTTEDGVYINFEEI